MRATKSPTRQTDSKKQYVLGWRAGQDPTTEKVTRADARQAPTAWYLGFADAERGREKFSGMPTVSP